MAKVEIFDEYVRKVEYAKKHIRECKNCQVDSMFNGKILSFRLSDEGMCVWYDGIYHDEENLYAPLNLFDMPLMREWGVMNSLCDIFAHRRELPIVMRDTIERINKHKERRVYFKMWVKNFITQYNNILEGKPWHLKVRGNSECTEPQPFSFIL